MSSLNEPIFAFDILGTEVIDDDIFQDRFDASTEELQEILQSDLPELWLSNPDIYDILKSSPDLETARRRMFAFLNRCEDRIFETDNDLHILEKNTIRECVRTFKSIIGAINEKRTKNSALTYLHRLARGTSPDEIPELRKGFIVEFIHLFRGVAGLSGIYSRYGLPEKKSVPPFIAMDGRQAARVRSDFLDTMAHRAEEWIAAYRSGLDPAVIDRRRANRERILAALGGREEDWTDYRWHLRHVIKTAERLERLVDLSDDEQTAVRVADAYRIPFGITPYYVSLMDQATHRRHDHAVRAQVIPPASYVEYFARHKQERHEVMDFMGEHDTSPIDLVTRRYPQIAILKPYNTCAQICVYCQRNWEIEGCLDPRAECPPDVIGRAVDWIRRHDTIQEVLVTGGDPLVLPDGRLRRILDALAGIAHVRRIRIGSRMPVVLPWRITPELAELLSGYVEPGRRELCLATHFEHCYEVTPEAAEAVSRLRRAGVAVYNQQVFTFENSRRFETMALRRALRLIGVDPYYSFITKGKEETGYYRVPVARILQERKEEARLSPGLDRTDEPVFNVPRLGKNHLRAWQDHRLITILPDGRRVYECHPWEKNITPIPPYNYIDVSIYGYLKRLAERGEDPMDYKSIWYYY